MDEALMMNSGCDDSPERVLYGLSCSYFTGKLEAYFQVKGLPFRFVEMSRSNFRMCARETGVVQLPCTHEPDGSWLTDTTPIISHFEAKESGPRIKPTEPAVAFVSLVFEDLFDEWYWRPALYYRWAHDDDARLLSTELASAMLHEVRLPFFLKRWFILLRQQMVYLRKDGVTKETAPLIEQMYLDSLDALEAIFATRPFLLGDRPCEADFGLFGPFFRHFFCDPTSGALMRKRAPHVAHWVTRLWKTRPADLEGAGSITSIPEDLGFFFQMISEDYLPYLAANAEAVGAQEKDVIYDAQGVTWRIPTAPYRAQCLNALKLSFSSLDDEARKSVAHYLAAGALEILAGPQTEVPPVIGRTGRLGRAAEMFD